MGKREDVHPFKLRFLLLLKIGFVTLDPPRDSDKLCILLQGFVWETYVSDMKIVHKIRSERFQNVFLSIIPIYKRRYCYWEQNLVQ